MKFLLMEGNLLNCSGNWLLILLQVIQAIEAEFTIFNLQNTFTTEFESILYVNYFTVPLQSYSLQFFLLSHWHRSSNGGSHILHLLTHKSTLLCKQVQCCCKSSFAGSQTSCTCMSSAREGLQVSMLLWLSVVQEAPCPLSIHDPPLIQDPA